MQARLAEAMDYVEAKRKELLQSFAGAYARPPWTTVRAGTRLGLVIVMRQASSPRLRRPATTGSRSRSAIQNG